MNTDCFGPAARPDEETKQAAHVRHEQLAKPTGSPGRLEELGIWISACQGRRPSCDLDDCRVYVFAGDHGVIQGGVSAYLSEVSIQMLANIETKGTGVNAIADIVGTTIAGADTSLGHDAEGPYRIRRSYGFTDREDAMNEEEVDRAIRAGIAIVDAAVDEGTDLLVVGDLGIGNTTPTVVLVGSMTNSEPVVVVGRGTSIDDEGRKLKVTAVRDAMFHVRRLRNDPVKVFCRISSPDMTAMVAFLAQVTVRRTPVILNGAVVTSVALLADQLTPGARDRWVAGHKSVEPAHALTLRHLDREPLLKYGMRPGEGSGVVVALSLVKPDVSVLRDMATSADTDVSTKD